MMSADHWRKLELLFNLVEVMDDPPRRSAMVGYASVARDASLTGVFPLSIINRGREKEEGDRKRRGEVQ